MYSCVCLYRCRHKGSSRPYIALCDRALGVIAFLAVHNDPLCRLFSIACVGIPNAHGMLS
jgi:hypothetical protein